MKATLISTFVAAVLVLGSTAGLPVAYADDTHEESHTPTTRPSPTEGVVQTKCPVMEDEDIKREFHVDHKGKRVYFCCKRCKAAFLRSPEKYIGALPQFTTAPSGTAVSEQDHHGAAEGEHAAKHDHARDHNGPQALARLVRFLGKFHIMAVHFPIALILTAALAEILAVVLRMAFFRDAARFIIIIGAISAGFAAALGWANGAFAGYSGDFSGTLTIHRWLGTSVAVLAIISAILSEKVYRRGRPAVECTYRIALGLSVILVGLTGYFGGVLVYGFERYSW